MEIFRNVAVKRPKNQLPCANEHPEKQIEFRKVDQGSGFVEKLFNGHVLETF